MGAIKIKNKKRFLLIFGITLLFLLSNAISPEIFFNKNNNTNIPGVVYAKGIGGSRSSGGSGFKSSGFSSSKSSSGSFSTPKSSSGGFKSGSFSTPKSSSGSGSSKSDYTSPSGSSKSSSGGFKSGGFSNTPNSSGSSTNKSGGFLHSSGDNKTSYDSGTKRSFIPIPIPIPWGSHTYYGSSYGNPISAIGSIIGGLFKFILFVIVLIIIIKIIKNSKRKY